jgi:ubiquinone/menaquinone biosynthesis C-methylase UbiE
MDDWRSYDDVAETYERVHARRFAEPARDLVETAALAPGAHVLDLGTGTGVAAEIAAGTLGGWSTVIGVDASLRMLEVGRRSRPTFEPSRPGPWHSPARNRGW